MVNLRNRQVAGPVALLVTMVVTMVAALVYGSAATTSAAPARAAAAAAGPVAKTPDGALRSRVVGNTAGGRDVSGEFVPLKFIKRNGKVKVRGLVQGEVLRDNGSVAQRFGVVRTMRVKSIEGTPIRTAAQARQAAQAAPCDILNLVLGPLDLDLLGLQVHLDRVVLNIVAQSGAGNLLGNLLCSVAGLLDGGLGGVLGRLTRLLNRILGQLNLGV
jgi:hypothetical protein